MKITEWHYIICLYYNKNDIEPFNQHLIAQCNNKDKQYIFFNPLESKYYNRKFNELQKL